MEKIALVKQYKVLVNNNNLDYFNGIRIKVTWNNAASNHKIVLVSDGSINVGGNGVKFVVLSNGTINGETEYIIPSPAVGTIELLATDATKPTEFVMFGMESIKSLYIYSSVLGQGVYMHNPDRMKSLPNLSLYNYELPVMLPYTEDDACDISDFIASYPLKSTVQNFRYSTVDKTPNSLPLVSTDAIKEYTSITQIGEKFFIPGVTYGDIINLRNLINLTSVYINNTEVYGDIASLAKCVSLTSVYTNNTKVSGSIESFVRGQYQNGRTSASNVEFGANVLITYNNGTNVLDSRKYVSWSGTDIDHITITVSSTQV